MNLTNKKRLTKDIVIYENFISEEDCKKMIQALDAQAENGVLSWMPISFYESYSSVLPQDNDKEVLDAGLSPTIFSDIENKMPEAEICIKQANRENDWWICSTNEAEHVHKLLGMIKKSGKKERVVYENVNGEKIVLEGSNDKDIVSYKESDPSVKRQKRRRDHLSPFFYYIFLFISIFILPISYSPMS